jgi:hypothetical protein
MLQPSTYSEKYHRSLCYVDTNTNGVFGDGENFPRFCRRNEMFPIFQNSSSYPSYILLRVHSGMVYLIRLFTSCDAVNVNCQLLENGCGTL